MTLQELKTQKNVTTIVHGRGRVNAYIQEHQPTQLAYREGVDVDQWITEDTPFVNGEGVVELRRKPGILTQAILDGYEILIYDVDRMGEESFKKLSAVITATRQTHFILALGE